MTIKRALLVDDDVMFGALMRKQAERHGIQLVHCLSVGEFLKAGPVAGFDLVLLDYDLGRIKGSALAEFCQVFFSKVPVVIVSSTSAWWTAR